MRKIILVWMLLPALLLSACGSRLGEKPGVFGESGLATALPPDEHIFFYDFATNHDIYSIYSNREYHYYYCVDSLYGGGCPLKGDFEAHTKRFSDFNGKPVLLYNGRYYHIANFVCTVCGSTAGSEYVLCSDSSETCTGECANATHYRELYNEVTP